MNENKRTDQENKIKTQRMKIARHNANLSLEDVSASLGINKSTLARWESGTIANIKSSFIKDLSELYGVSEKWLLGYDDSVFSIKMNKNEDFELVDSQSLCDIRSRRLKQCRLQKGMTISEVALCIGVNHSTYSRWESGVTNTMKYPSIAKLAQIYNVNPSWLWGYNIPKTNESYITKRSKINELLTGVSDADLDRVYQMIKLMLGKDTEK